MSRKNMMEMEMLQYLTDEERNRLSELIEKKNQQTLTKEEAEEYGRILGKAMVKAAYKWAI